MFGDVYCVFPQITGAKKDDVATHLLQRLIIGDFPHSSFTIGSCNKLQPTAEWHSFWSDVESPQERVGNQEMQEKQTRPCECLETWKLDCDTFLPRVDFYFVVFRVLMTTLVLRSLTQDYLGSDPNQGLVPLLPHLQHAYLHIVLLSSCLCLKHSDSLDQIKTLSQNMYALHLVLWYSENVYKKCKWFPF